MTDLIAEYLGGLHEVGQVLGRTHHIWRAADDERDRFADLLTWDALNEILSAQRLEPPRLRLAVDGGRLPVEDYCERRTYRRMPDWWAPRPDLVAAHLRDGATLVLDAVEEMHPPIRDLVAGLERHLRTGVQTNVYASWTSREGFGVHWDDHDTLILQLAGRKSWRVYGPTREAPLHVDVVHDVDPPDWEPAAFELAAGDVLHVPRGHWHAAAASTGQPSLHLTCGLATRTGVDLLRWVVDELRAYEVVRRDVPVTASPGERAGWADELVKLVVGALADPDLIGDFVAARDAAAPPLAGHSLPYTVQGDVPDVPFLSVRLACPRAVLAETPEGVALRAAGTEHVFDRRARPVLDALLEGQAVRLGALCARVGPCGLSGSQVRGVIGTLAAAGVVAVGESR